MGLLEVFPEHKYAIVKILQENGHIVGMTGDGVNDAPALKQADVGIAVSGATEAARAAAALVLTAPGLSVIIDGIAEARRIFERMTSYVLYRIAMTIAIMVFVVLASIYYPLFSAHRDHADRARASGRCAHYDDRLRNASVPPQPVRWELDRVLVISSVLGLLGVIQSFGLLYLGDTVHHLQHPQLQTMMFLQLVAGGHLMLFVSAREGSLLETAISQLDAFLRYRGDPNRGGVHVQPGLARAGTALGNHRLCVGLQHRVDDSAGHRETWTLSHSGSCSLVEAMAIRTAASPSGRHAKGCEVNQEKKRSCPTIEKNLW